MGKKKARTAIYICHALLWLLFSAMLSANSSKDESIQNTFSSADAFFSAIAITPTKGEHAPFVLTDNVSGYYESATFTSGGGEGYTIGEHTYLKDLQYLVNGKRLDTTHAKAAHIYPYGVTHLFEEGEASLILHEGIQGISFQWKGKAPDISTRIKWTDLLKAYQPCHEKKLAVYCPNVTKETPSRFLYVAVKESVDGDAYYTSIALAESKTAAIKNVNIMHGESAWEKTRQAHYERLTRNILWTSDIEFNRALVWAQASSYSFVVEEFGKGIWAGLPWFRDNWGRDTFIALPGTLLVNGQFEAAKKVIQNFARFQKRDSINSKEFGRIPNRVAANTDIIYNTVDGTPWMLRALWEYAQYSGEIDFLKQQWPLVKTYIKGVETHWLDEHGFLTHEDADTWMDARIANDKAWSPRGNRAVEIQALWMNTLDIAAEIAHLAGDKETAQAWQTKAEATRINFLKAYYHNGVMADRIEPDGTPDITVRPNQLLTISVPFKPVSPLSVEANVLKNAVSKLLFAHGIASLDPNHDYFHPRHVNDRLHHKDAAYHNGTVWGWNAGFTVTSLNKFGYQDLAYRLTRELGRQILKEGHRGTMSELLDASLDVHGKIKTSGTYAQSWSVAEFARNAYQDYVGFHPRVLANTLYLRPAVPREWSGFYVRLPYGENTHLDVTLNQSQGSQKWLLQFSEPTSLTLVMDFIGEGAERYRGHIPITKDVHTIVWDKGVAKLDGNVIDITLIQASYKEQIGELRFAQPPRYDEKRFPVLKHVDVLKDIIEAGKYQ